MSKTPRFATRHITKFAGGRETPREVHARLAVRRPCVICRQPGTMRIRVLVELSELERRRPDFCGIIKATNPNGSFIPTVATTYGLMVMLHDVGACDQCRKQAEVQVAHGAEDWMLVEIDRGPPAIRPQIQVPEMH